MKKKLIALLVMLSLIFTGCNVNVSVDDTGIHFHNVDSTQNDSMQSVSDNTLY